MADSTPQSVGIIGGGLAGLAAGCALADAGFRVTLLERRPYVGGRASSYEHPGTGEVVDNCQHVLLGCCTNLIHFYEQLGVGDKISWFADLTFIEPGGRASRIGPSFLPAPLHSLPSFFGAASLTLRDKLAIGRALMAIMRRVPADSQGNFLAWLRRHGQTQRAIDRFWKVVLVSALNEELDRSSVHYAAQVFRESFLKSAAAGRMGVPRVPLSELYGSAVDYIRRLEGEVLLRASVTAMSAAESGVQIALGDTRQQHFDYAILAAPFQTAAGLLPSDSLAGPLKEKLSRFEASPITGIHLWFDREITPLPHAVLLDRTIQWMFQKSKLHDARAAAGRGEQGSYIELVVSCSRSLVEKSRQEILDLALAELAEFFPVARQSRLVKATVIKEIYATYSVRPGLDQYRPPAATGWPRVFLAGDWTATGWPATMEGAVRSGYMAAEALTAAAGRAMKVVVPDLPASGVMKIFS